LAKRSDTLILLSATPHDGRPESFASLMNMLDPTAIADESHYSKEDIRQLYIRRFKKDVQADLKKYVPERRVQSVESQASSSEEQVLSALGTLPLGRSQDKGSQLFKTTLLKAMLSSPMACLETVENRLKRLQRKENSPAAEPLEIQALRQLQSQLQLIKKADFSKYQRLLRLIRDDFAWKGQSAQDRLVIFTGRLKTLQFLQENLAKDLGLSPQVIAVLDGGMADTDQLQVVEAFGQEQSPTRILIATEVASEGLNLHYLSHKLIHFDIPWSLMTLQQRNGRIDRYGQTKAPEIRYLLTRSRTERMDEVERIIQVLIRKDEQAMLNIGDPSVFMGVFDAQKEEEWVETVISDGLTAQEFEQALDNNAQSGGEIDIFAWFEAEDEDLETTEETPSVEIGSLPSLFSTDFDYAVSSLQNLETIPPNLSINPQERLIELQFPQGLKSRYERLPEEIQPQAARLLQLSDRRERIMQEMERARRQDNTWSRVEYLWPLHPLLEWLNDRNLFRFGRHQAPVLALPKGLQPQEAVFIFFGNYPNHRGAPLLTRWISVCFQGQAYDHSESLAETLQRTGLGQQPIPNRGQLKLEALMGLRELAVQKALGYLRQEQQQFNAQLQPQLAEQLQRLEHLRERHYQQLDLGLSDSPQPPNKQQQKALYQKRQIDGYFEDYRRWVKSSMTLENDPFLKLVAVLTLDE
jgi:hypothetical protein